MNTMLQAMKYQIRSRLHLFFTRAAKPWLSSSSSFEMFHEFTSSYPHLFTATAEKTCISEISAMSCIQLYGE